MNWYTFFDVLAWGVAGVGLLFTLGTLIMERDLYFKSSIVTLIALAYLVARL